MTAAADGIRPRLRPLSLGEILDVSIKIFTTHWRTLVKAVLVVVVPVQIVGTIINADYTLDSMDVDGGTGTSQSVEEFDQYLGGVAIASILQICAVLLATAACFRAIAQAYLGEQTDWRSSLQFALRLAPSLLLITLLYMVGILLGTLLFVLPGIWLYISWAFAMPALLVEGRRGRQALGRSFTLVKGRWWRTFGVIVVGFILAAIISTLVQAVFFVGVVVGADNDAVVLLFSALAGIVGLAISTPFQAALLTVLYFDLRVRQEGFDLELLAEEIGARFVPEDSAAPVAPILPPAAPDGAGAGFQPPPPSWRPPPAAGGDAPPDEPPRLPGVPHG